MESPSITPMRRSGNEEIVCDQKNQTLLNLWRWAYSDLIGNTERGIIVEYLVALACGIDHKPRISWDAYDMQLENGIKIEVKSTGYLQTWKQKNFSKPMFNIPKTFAWDSTENVYETLAKRQADVYVFAVHAHKDIATINSLDTNQWEFYVISTTVLNDKVGDKKQIGLNKLLELGAIRSNFNDLLHNIIKAK